MCLLCMDHQDTRTVICQALSLYVRSGLMYVCTWAYILYASALTKADVVDVLYPGFSQHGARRST